MRHIYFFAGGGGGDNIYARAQGCVYVLHMREKGGREVTDLEPRGSRFICTLALRSGSASGGWDLLTRAECNQIIQRYLFRLYVYCSISLVL